MSESENGMRIFRIKYGGGPGVQEESCRALAFILPRRGFALFMEDREWD